MVGNCQIEIWKYSGDKKEKKVSKIFAQIFRPLSLPFLFRASEKRIAQPSWHGYKYLCVLLLCSTTVSKQQKQLHAKTGCLFPVLTNQQWLSTAIVSNINQLGRVTHGTRYRNWIQEYRKLVPQDISSLNPRTLVPQDISSLGHWFPRT